MARMLLREKNRGGAPIGVLVPAPSAKSAHSKSLRTVLATDASQIDHVKDSANASQNHPLRPSLLAKTNIFCSHTDTVTQ